MVLDAANDARLARDLTAGGAFVVGYDLSLSQECELLVHNGAAELRLVARVVYVDPIDPARGVGLELVGFGSAVRDKLAALVDGSGACVLPAGSTPADLHAIGSSPTVPLDGTTREAVSQSSIEAAKRRAGRASVMRTSPSGSNPDLLHVDDIDGTHDAAPAIARLRLRKSTPPATEPIDLAALVESELALGSERQHPTPDQDDDDAEAERIPRTVHERIRGLNLAEQLKLAHGGDINERIVLERLYGKNVWEPLLRNPRLTPPEVARIAKMGALPRILIEIIVANGGWLGVPDVRRALLTNPRLGTDQIIKVLKMMPKLELRLIPAQVALPMAVREAAKRLLRGEML